MTSYREEAGQKVLKYLHDHPEINVAVDTETEGLRPDDGRDTCIGVSITFVHENKKGISHYFGLNHTVGENISDKTLKMLRFVLERQNRWLIFANRQFDVLSLETVGFTRVDRMPFFDIQTMAQMIDENVPVKKSLENLAKHYLNDPEAEKVTEQMVNDEGDVFDVVKEKKSGWLNTTPKMMWDYACMDTELTYRVAAVMRKHPRWLELPDHLWLHKQRLIRLLTEFRRRGVAVNVPLAASEEAYGVNRMEEIKAELGLDPAKRNDLQELLLVQLKLPVLARSKITKEPSFTKEVMDEYDEILERLGSPVAKLVKEFRGWQKAVGSFFRPYQVLLSEDGRLRATYNTHTTRTGRLSCSDPNLQQIPKKSDDPDKKRWMRHVKECFVPRPGYRLINADFSQLELRIAAGYANEEGMKQVFLEGRDIFTEMAAELKMSRPDTKVLVYTMNYGGGIKRLRTVFGVSTAKANEIRQNYFDKYSRLKAFNDTVASKADRQKQIAYWTGRIRHFQYQSESYKAFNSLIQGGAADIVERVMIRLWDEIDGPDCMMIQQVHDSLLFEIREDLVEEYSAKIHTIMEDVDAVTGELGSFNVKFAVEVEEWGA